MKKMIWFKKKVKATRRERQRESRRCEWMGSGGDGHSGTQL